MFLIIHHANAWASAVAKYNMEEDDIEAPKSFPILVSLPLNEDNEAMDGVSLIYPSQAAKLLSVCANSAIMSIPESIRTPLYTNLLEMFGQKAGIAKPISKLLPLLKIPGVVPVTAVGVEGSIVKYNLGNGSGFKVGDQITMDGEKYTITQIGDSLAAADPITGEDGIIEVADEPTSKATISGLEEVPMDPSKFDEKHKIADLGDSTAHVLDVERDV